MYILEKAVEKAKPYHLKFGLNHVTKLIEERKAKLVAIASNVDPIELVVWLPALCRKMDIPYCFVNGKAKLGQLVHQKNAAVVCLTDIRKEDEGDLNNLANSFRTNFNNNLQMRKEIGGFKRGSKSQIKYNKLMAVREKETIQKQQWSWIFKIFSRWNSMAPFRYFVNNQAWTIKHNLWLGIVSSFPHDYNILIFMEW